MSWRSLPSIDGPGKRGAQSVTVATYQALLRNLSPRLIRLSLTFGVGLIALFVIPSMTRGAGTEASVPAVKPSTSLSPTPQMPTVPGGVDRATYWIGAHEIEGVTSGLPPGTRVQIWVTWEPPLVDQPVVEKLIGDAYIEAILPSTMLEGALDVGLSLRDRDIRVMTYGERFGSLNLVVVDR